MWLLNAETHELESFEGGNLPRYAILSHRWEEDEPTFKDVAKKRCHDKKGFQKVEACCKKALAKNLSYVWVDTCCIDKRNSAELSEAINSMYEWYSKSTICFAYLSDIEPEHEGCKSSIGGSNSQVDLTKSVWFARGWTLQELLAPLTLCFYNSEWNYIGSKIDHAIQIRQRTNIPEKALRSFHPTDWSILERMSWTTGRETTRVEDRAYSLLGIFEVNMPLLYGERSRAFKRLQETIAASSHDLSLFSWTGLPHDDNQLLANSPRSFSNTFSLRWYGRPEESPLQPVRLQARSKHFTSYKSRYVLTKDGIEGMLPLHHYVFNIYCLTIGHFTPFIDTVSNYPMKDMTRPPTHCWICIFLEYDGPANVFRRVCFEGENCIALGVDGFDLLHFFDKFQLPRVSPKDCKIVNQPITNVSATRFASQQWHRFLGLTTEKEAFGIRFMWAGCKWRTSTPGNAPPSLLLYSEPLAVRPWSKLGDSPCLVFHIQFNDSLRNLQTSFIVISFEVDPFSGTDTVLFFFSRSDKPQEQLLACPSNGKSHWNFECAAGNVTLVPTEVPRGRLKKVLNTFKNRNMGSKALCGNKSAQKSKTTMLTIELGPSRRRRDPESLLLTISKLSTSLDLEDRLFVALHLDFNCYVPGMERLPSSWADFPGLESMPHISIWGRDIYEESFKWPEQSTFEEFVQEADYIPWYTNPTPDAI